MSNRVSRRFKKSKKKIDLICKHLRVSDDIKNRAYSLLLKGAPKLGYPNEMCEEAPEAVLASCVFLSGQGIPLTKAKVAEAFDLKPCSLDRPTKHLREIAWFGQ